MATKAVNFKTDERRIDDMKAIAAVFNLTMTDMFNEAMDAYLSKLKADPFYRLSVGIPEASEEESAEILGALDAMTDDDLEITTVRHLAV